LQNAESETESQHHLFVLHAGFELIEEVPFSKKDYILKFRKRQ